MQDSHADRDDPHVRRSELSCCIFAMDGMDEHAIVDPGGGAAGFVSRDCGGVDGLFALRQCE